MFHLLLARRFLPVLLDAVVLHFHVVLARGVQRPRHTMWEDPTVVTCPVLQVDPTLLICGSYLFVAPLEAVPPG